MSSKQFIGSTIALVLGGIYFLSGLSSPGAGLVAGLVILLGASAYRSRKKTNLSLVKTSKQRSFFEVLAVVIAMLITVMQANYGELIAEAPVPNFIIPLWVIIAYLVVYFRGSKPNTEKMSAVSSTKSDSESND